MHLAGRSAVNWARRLLLQPQTACIRNSCLCLSALMHSGALWWGGALVVCVVWAVSHALGVNFICSLNIFISLPECRNALHEVVGQVLTQKCQKCNAAQAHGHLAVPIAHASINP